jgi:hypothetical protein
MLARTLVYLYVLLFALSSFVLADPTLPLAIPP